MERFAVKHQQAKDEVQALRNKIERTQAETDAFDEERGSEDKLQRLEIQKKNLQADMENAETELLEMREQQKQQEKLQEVDKQRRSLASKERERDTLEEKLKSTKQLDDFQGQVDKLNGKRSLHGSEQIFKK